MFENAANLAKRAAIGADRLQADNAPTIGRLFMLFHAWYGNLFLSKFATGDLDEQGKDRGIKSARIVWQNELQRFDQDTVVDAANRAKVLYAEFPPSLPQFLALCRAAAPHPTTPRDHDQVKAIPMGAELKSSYSRKARESAIANLRARMDAHTGHTHTDGGLCGLGQLIAKAVALAGGDEAAELRRFDGLMAGKAAA